MVNISLTFIVGYLYMAMTDYPSPSDFLQPLPAWPVKVACQYFSPETTDLLTAMRLSVGVYYNSTGTQSCFDIFESESSSIGDAAWNYQACTEMVMPIQTNGITDMFLPAPWDYEAYSLYCLDTYGTLPRPEWSEISFWGHQIEAATNIIFSNGMLDPWMPGGVTYNVSSSLPAILIHQGAHHLDLRTPDSSDPQSVVDARNQEREIIAGWLGQ
jgi:lysosomal Pro-X carboxypeptidase